MDIIIIPTQDSKRLTPLQQVVSCQIKPSKTIFYLANNEVVESVESFTHFENRFKNGQFFKPNQNQLVNVNYIEKILFKEPLVIIMKNQKEIAVDHDKKEALFQIIENI